MTTATLLVPAPLASSLAGGGGHWSLAMLAIQVSGSMWQLEYGFLGTHTSLTRRSTTYSDGTGWSQTRPTVSRSWHQLKWSEQSGMHSLARKPSGLSSMRSSGMWPLSSSRKAGPAEPGSGLGCLGPTLLLREALPRLPSDLGTELLEVAERAERTERAERAERMEWSAVPSCADGSCERMHTRSAALDRKPVSGKLTPGSLKT
mmetsp:Transcript_26257/g.83117  ORF Transcript_26257/g.83117 Transcript_26257/m.83117 type:complete len:204 (-) Transcript_26257:1657-2268(-)